MTVNDESKRMWKEAAVTYMFLSHDLLGNSLLMETTKYRSMDSRSSSQKLDPDLLES
jgi:hypothetical protein